MASFAVEEMGKEESIRRVLQMHNRGLNGARAASYGLKTRKKK